MKHVLLGAFSPMLQSIIVDALSTRSDVSLLIPHEAGAALSGCGVDVVLTTAGDPENLDAVIDLLRHWPKSRMIVVAPSGRDAVLYELAPRKQVLGDLCPATLVEAICGERQ